jgi:hypothetical protein
VRISANTTVLLAVFGRHQFYYFKIEKRKKGGNSPPFLIVY